MGALPGFRVVGLGLLVRVVCGFLGGGGGGGGGPIFGMSVDFCECLSAGFSHVSRVYVWGWGFGSALVHL